MAQQNQEEIVERVKARLQEEGREARNLVAYSLPLQDVDSLSDSSGDKSKDANPFENAKEPKPTKAIKRHRSASAGRDPQASLRARHWGFLFRNLQQAVDEIYQTCEDDESIIECKEAILMLGQYTKDFDKLIDWLKVKWEYENTLPLERPTSLTWEIRTSSPGKAIQGERKLSLREVKRVLNFDKLDGGKNVGMKMSKKIQEECLASIANENGFINEESVNGNWYQRLLTNKPPSTKKTQDTKVDDVNPTNFETTSDVVISGDKENNLLSSSENHNNNQKEDDNFLACSNLKKANLDNANKVKEKENNTTVENDKQKCKEDNLNDIRIKIDKADESPKSLDENIYSSNFDATDDVDNLLKVVKEDVVSKSLENIEESCKSNLMSDKSSSETKLCEKVVPIDLKLSKIGRQVSSNKTTLNRNNVRKKKQCVESISTSKENVPNLKSNNATILNKRIVKNKTISNTNKEVKTKADVDDSSEKMLKVKRDKEVKIKTDVDDSSEKMLKVKRDKDKEVKTKIDVDDSEKMLKVKRDKSFTKDVKETIKAEPKTVKNDSDEQSAVKLETNQKTHKEKNLSNVLNSENGEKSLTKVADDQNEMLNNSVDPPMSKLHQDLQQNKNSRSVPQVNMNKASQVRQAYNQNRTPQKQSHRTFAGQDLKSFPNKHMLSQNKRNLRRSRGDLKQTSSSKSDSNGINSDKPSHPPGPRRAHTTLGTELFNTSSSGSKYGETRLSTSSIASSTTSSPAGLSWADKVKGCSSSSQKSTPSELSLQEDSDGWEVVRRGRRSQGGSTTSLNLANNTIKKQVKNLPKNGFSSIKAKCRFNVPSAAMSLPSLNVGVEKENSRRASESNFTSNKLSNSVKSKNSVKKNVKSPIAKDKNSPKKDSSHSEKKNSCNINDQIVSDNCSKMNNNETLINSSDDKLPQSENDDKSSEKKNGTNSPLKNDTYGAKINELSETSDGEDTPTESKDDSSDSSNLLNVYKDVNRSYDSDSGMDEEEIIYNAAALESAVMEEERLKQQIEETEKTEIEVEEVCNVENLSDSDSSGSLNRASKYHNLLNALSWAEQIETLQSLEELRHPGRVLHIHEKLSSPSRKLSLTEKMRKHQDKLAKAQELRGKLMMAKTEKLKDLFKRIDEVHIEKEKLMEEKRMIFERKMERAGEKRKQHIQEIIDKAHDEEKKAKEIAFINGLEAQNKLHDIMQQHQSHESRLADMAEERFRKQEEKAAKEAKAQERRRALEAERQARMEELCEKRRQKCERIDRQQAERREEMLEQAREKARDHKERLSTIHQAQQAKETELAKRIQQKLEDSTRRHEENMELIRQKALESSIMNYSKGCDDAPKLTSYETKKLCTLCNCLIASEVYLLSHLRSHKHQEALREIHKSDISNAESATYNLKHIVNAPANIDDPQVTKAKDRQKSLKKKCRKLRTRMTTRAKEFLTSYNLTCPKDSPNKAKITKNLQQITKLVSNQGTGPWNTPDVSSLDKCLLELQRIFEKEQASDQMTFCALEGFDKVNGVLEMILKIADNQTCVVPTKSLGYCGKVILLACKSNKDICRFLLNSNIVGILVDYLVKRFEILSLELNNVNSYNSLPSDTCIVSIFEVCTELLNILIKSDLVNLSSNDSKEKEVATATWQRLQDFISYCVSVGVADKVSWYLSHVQGSVDDAPGTIDIILSSMSLISTLAKTLALRPTNNDPTQLIGTFHVTDVCGVVSLLYGLLLHQGGRLISQSPSQLSSTTTSITEVATSLLHNLASLDLNMFQTILGSEGISLEFRHIASYLLWYSSHWTCESILHNIITLVGFFTVNNKENQMIVQSGEMPSVLQQLINLPWPYFSELNLSSILFPTLLACCLNNPDNLYILKQEMSFDILEVYLKEQNSEESLLKLLQRTHVQG